jgi:hypothetical protein
VSFWLHQKWKDIIYQSNYKEEEIYATSLGAVSIAGGTLEEGAVVEGDGSGMINSMSFAEYFFTSAKNIFISAGPKARDELTFAQSISLACDIDKAIIASAPIFTEDLLN